MSEDEVKAVMAALVRAGWTVDDAEEVAEAAWRAGCGLTDESGRWLALALANLVTSAAVAA